MTTKQRGDAKETSAFAWKLLQDATDCGAEGESSSCGRSWARQSVNVQSSGQGKHMDKLCGRVIHTDAKYPTARPFFGPPNSLSPPPILICSLLTRLCMQCVAPASPDRRWTAEGGQIVCHALRVGQSARTRRLKRVSLHVASARVGQAEPTSHLLHASSKVDGAWPAQVCSRWAGGVAV
ncbi:unnamed protein product [Protopolystoma xenopodis]|uniref:Uncharacterized protein n=1 Tax=Protopolystoma xenopodis TaxID=117903 RepID=A0A448XQ22_9PLAT|nr:unnamed protein product [Protopolystoma xenopodis]